MTPADAPLDPRPAVVEEGGHARLVGGRCQGCRYPLAFPRPRCPVCGGQVVDATFGPAGRIWSATVVRIVTPGREPPYALAYVDLDDGPRVLAHVRGASVPPDVGTPVRLVASTDQGDLQVEAVG